MVDTQGDTPLPAVQPEAGPQPLDVLPASRALVVVEDTSSEAAVPAQEVGFAGPDPAAAVVPVQAPHAPETRPIPEPIEVEAFNWDAVADAVLNRSVVARSGAILSDLATLLDRPEGPGLLFDADRAGPGDRAIKVSATATDSPLWVIGDLHGDLLALEAALALIAAEHPPGMPPARLVLLGDLFDDQGLGLEVLLRVFELIVVAPERICVIVGNHDEALAFADGRFTSSVDPSDFADLLNHHIADENVARAGMLAMRLFAQAPRALFLPDGLLLAHAGFPLVDLHPRLSESGNWNDPACLSDFVWTRAHPRARRKLPNRYTRGSQYGHEDFAAFCALSAQLGRPVTHLVRGHDHVEGGCAVYGYERPNPILTTVALSRPLPRETIDAAQRLPTVVRVKAVEMPQVFRLHIPPALVAEVYGTRGSVPPGDGRESEETMG